MMKVKELQKLIATRPYLVWWTGSLSLPLIWTNCASDGGLIKLDEETLCDCKFKIINPNYIPSIQNVVIEYG